MFWLAVAMWSVFLLGHGYYAWQVMPHDLNQDEAALLLNARLLWTSGIDEWQQPLNPVIRSFGDAKLPGMVVFTMLVGAVTDFASWSVRVPSWIASAFLPLAVAGLVWSLTRQARLGLLSAFFLALSPWTWHYGTVGFEAHVALLFLVLALWSWLRERPHWASDLSGVGLFLVALWTYNTPLLLSPFLLVLMIRRLPDWRAVARGSVLVILPVVLVAVLTLSATRQKGAITVFQDPTVLHEYPEYRAQFHSPFLRTAIGNQWVYFGRLITENWIDSWSWTFLVSKGGGNPWHSIPGIGHLHPYIPPMAVLGLVMGVWWILQARSRNERDPWLILLWLTLISLAPAVVTVDAPHATRSLFFFILLSIWASVGLAQWYDGACRAYGTRWWWAGFRAIVALFFVAGFGWWWSVAPVRWQQWVSPRWNIGLAEVLQSPSVQNASHVTVISASSGSLYPVVSEALQISGPVFWETVERQGPDTVGLYEVLRLERFSFLPFGSEPESGEVILEQKGNTAWDIIESDL